MWYVWLPLGFEGLILSVRMWAPTQNSRKKFWNTLYVRTFSNAMQFNDVLFLPIAADHEIASRNKRLGVNM
jgi:hypothetical protein